MKFLCESCKAKYQIADDKVSGKTVRMKCRRCGHLIEISSNLTESSVARRLPTDPGAAAAASHHADVPNVGGIFDEETDEQTRIMPADDIPAIARAVPPPAASQPFALTTPRSRPPPAARPKPVSALKPMLAPRPGGIPRPAAAGLPRPGALGGARGIPSSRPLGTPASGPGATAQAEAIPPIAEPPMADPGVAAAFVRAVADQPASATRPPPAHAQSENWYVGVGGVSLGPVRLAVIREKAAAGAVNGESLVWREGFDEWLPLRNFPELLEIIEEVRPAASTLRRPTSSGRHVTPMPGPLGLKPAAPPDATEPEAALFASPEGLAPAPPLEPAPPPPPSAPAAAALAELPLPPPSESARSVPPPSAASAPRSASIPPSSAPLAVLSDPFAGPAPSAAPKSARPSTAPEALVAAGVPRRQGMHPAAYAFIAMAAVFGGVAAFVLLSRPEPQIVVVQGPAPTATQGAEVAADAPKPAETGEAAPAEVPSAEASSEASPGAASKVAAGGAAAKAGDPKGTSKSSSSGAAPLDTSGFGTTGIAGPSAEAPGGSNNAGAGGQLSQGEISAVVAQNQPLVKRKCWQPALDSSGASGPKTARVAATIVIAGSGNVQSASASGAASDFPGLASCISSRIKSWKFPPSSGPTTVNVPFVFASQ